VIIMNLKKPKVIISIPAYNEEKTLPSVIAEIKNIMKKTNYNYKIHVLNDGSSDKTALVAKKAGAAVTSNKINLGLAETFRREMKYFLNQKADIFVHIDADGQYPAAYIPRMIKGVQEGSDMVVGSRFGFKGQGKYAGPVSKRLGNIIFAKALEGLTRQKIPDTTTGYRAFTREVAMLPVINDFTYTQEQLIRAGRAGMKITSVPIYTNKTRKSRLFKGTFDYAVRAWINIFRIYRDYKPLKFFGSIGLVFFLIGFILGLYVTYDFLLTGLTGIYQKVPTILLAVLFLTTGLQIILFGFLSDKMR